MEGRTLEDLFAGRPVNIPEMLERMQQVARAEGLAFGDRRMTYNSRLAQELGKWAESLGRGEPFHHAAFVAYFGEGKNIAMPEVLVETALDAGLPAEEARQVIDERRFQTAVDRDWQRSRRLGVTAVPTFMVDGQRLVGAQPYEAMERFVADAGAQEKG